MPLKCQITLRWGVLRTGTVGARPHACPAALAASYRCVQGMQESCPYCAPLQATLQRLCLRRRFTIGDLERVYKVPLEVFAITELAVRKPSRLKSFLCKQNPACAGFFIPTEVSRSVNRRRDTDATRSAFVASASRRRFTLLETLIGMGLRAKQGISFGIISCRRDLLESCALLHFHLLLTRVAFHTLRLRDAHQQRRTRYLEPLACEELRNRAYLQTRDANFAASVVCGCGGVAGEGGGRWLLAVGTLLCLPSEARRRIRYHAVREGFIPNHYETFASEATL